MELVKRFLEIIANKLKAIFLPSMAFSSRVEKSSISKKAKVWGNCRVFHSELGDYSYLGPNSRLIHTRVGRFCSIAANCIIGMGSHPLNYLSTSSIFTAPHNGLGQSWTKKAFFEEYKPIVIGNDVWIGQRVMIIGGVKIGDGAVVGAGAIVTNDVPPYAIVAGVPARIIRYRFSDDIIAELECLKWWDIPDNVLKDNITFFHEYECEKAIKSLLKNCF